MSPPLTPRERVMLALERKAVDRVPISMIGSYLNPAPRRALEAYLRRTRGMDVDTFLKPVIDLEVVAPVYIGPRLAPDTDYWGVRRRMIQAGGDSYAEIEHYPLAGARTIDEIMAYPMPAPDWFDYGSISRQIEAIKAEGDHAIWFYGPANIFESAWYLRGYEQIFIDLVEDPELAEALMTRITDFFVEHHRRALAAGQGRIDLVLTADDVAGQRGPLLSLPLWERFIKPHHQRINRVIHEFGARVIYHSDGAVMDFVPGLIDMGIDILESLQLDADGMDAVGLKRKYGDRLGFCGGLSVQQTLPFGSVRDVQEEVRFLVRTFGRGGGYLFGPSHAIQGDTPPENIVAMFETALTCR